MALEMTRRALIEAVTLAAPLLGAAVLVGVLVSVIQAVTQVQEQTLSFVPKLGAVAAVFLIALSWMLRSLTAFATELFRAIPTLAP